MHRLVLSLAALSAAVLARCAYAAPPPLEAYGRLPAIQNVALSPSGDRFAVVVADKDGRKVVVRTSTGAAVAALGFGAVKVRDVEFAGEDHVLIFETATVAPWVGSDNFEVEGIVDLNLKTRASYMIFNKSNTFLDVVLGYHGARQVDGHWYAYVGAVPLDKHASPREHVIFPDLYRVDLDTGKPTLVASSTQRPRGWLIGADGQVIANALYDRDHRGWSIFRGDVVGQPLFQRDGVNSLSFVAEGRRPGTILVKERIGETTDLREIGLDGQGDGVVIAEDDIQTRPIFDRDTGLTVGLVDITGHVSLFDPNLQKRIDASVAAFGGDRSVLITHSRNFGRMIFLTDGPTNAGRYWLVDAVERTAVPIGDVWPEVGPDQVGPTRMFAFKAADGLPLEGALSLPPGRQARNLPLVVMPHAGPNAGGNRTNYYWWAQAFASRGYAVFQPNYRGTQGYGDTFRKAADSELNRKMQTDISDGVQALATAGIVDPKRACIVGHDFGGYMALSGVTLQHGLYRCAVAVAGQSDINRWLLWTRDRDSVAGQQIREAYWRGLSGNASGEVSPVSPLRAASAADAPILLMHGEKDSTVPIEQSQMMQNALLAAGKPAEFVSLNAEDHALSNAATRQAMLTGAVAFVEKHNPPN